MPQLNDIPVKEIIDEDTSPSDEVIAELKKKYREIYAVTINGKTYIYTYLTKQMWDSIISIPGITPQFQELKILEKCLLWPQMRPGIPIDDKAGTQSTLVELIMRASGFAPDVEPIRL